jgi:hypothetical protein
VETPSSHVEDQAGSKNVRVSVNESNYIGNCTAQVQTKVECIPA